VRRTRTTAEVYRRFGEVDAAGTLYEAVAVALSGSAEALRAIETVPARKRQPALILAALHDLALAGRAPGLAAAYAAADGTAAATAAIDTLRRGTEAVAGIAARRRTRTMGPTAHAALHPLVAEAARRVGAGTIGLVDVGGFNLHVDRVGITYDGGRTLGDPASPVQVTASARGGPVPATPIPEVVARIAVDPDPLDLTDPDDARWLRACLPPERVTDLDAELALATPATLLAGDPVEMLPEAVARVPAGALPVVTTTWALSRHPPGARLRFLQHLATAGRPVAWVSVEGVGVAPAVPTFGDRPASGHSILGMVVLGHSTLHAEAVGRCWSRGRILTWLAAE
jgi:hypothetical protein